ncbi:helix-turn-helix transcriptional regulator [Halorussus caseinilyticus]|uniref:helix-turn-helix transcriptional regulator n=1 Tax=Halorussus caseinilyticus TaxID=3034025 RepID=UPI0023E89C02|nr:hypothetical protein [Halorussus sp. DT72]
MERRIDVLDRLLDDGRDKRELVGSLDCSRSTVDRAVRELESYDLVEYAEGEYRPTTFGRLAVEEYRRFERRVETLERLKPALEWLPVEEFDLDFGTLTDSKLVVSTPDDPYAPANHHADVASQAENFRALLPAVGLNQLEAGREAAVEGDQRQRIVVERDVAERLRERPHYADRIAEMLRSGRVEMWVYDGSIPYFLGLYDELVHVGVEDEDGMPRALIETDAEAVREWAESVYDEYRRAARKFESERLA